MVSMLTLMLPMSAPRTLALTALMPPRDADDADGCKHRWSVFHPPHALPTNAEHAAYAAYADEPHARVAGPVVNGKTVFKKQKDNDNNQNIINIFSINSTIHNTCVSSFMPVDTVIDTKSNIT